jgi:phosphopentomutase
MPRAVVIVLDSVGIGGAPDAARYGDLGSDTVGHIAEKETLDVPTLTALGLGEACRLATGWCPPQLAPPHEPIGRYGAAIETSTGKDTPSGHWEIAGVPVTFDWGYFDRKIPAFPAELIEALCVQAALPGILGNCHASGTEIIATLGEEHLATGKPICYTSADSVFQIAAHEETFGLERLYRTCEIARSLVDRLRIGRVIARPFLGQSPRDFRRTANRHDYTTPPPLPTLLNVAEQADRTVISIGKTGDIFAHCGTGRLITASGNDALMDATIGGLPDLRDGGLMFVNLGDFDTLYGHRRDTPGYARALAAFDRQLQKLMDCSRFNDLVLITADHGCDPTWRGTDHTREMVPLLAYGRFLNAGSTGRRQSFADIGATVARHLALPALARGNSTGILD